MSDKIKSSSQNGLTIRPIKNGTRGALLLTLSEAEKGSVRLIREYHKKYLPTSEDFTVFVKKILKKMKLALLLLCLQDCDIFILFNKESLFR